MFLKIHFLFSLISHRHESNSYRTEIVIDIQYNVQKYQTHAWKLYIALEHILIRDIISRWRWSTGFIIIHRKWYIRKLLFIKEHHVHFRELFSKWHILNAYFTSKFHLQSSLTEVLIKCYWWRDHYNK